MYTDSYVDITGYCNALCPYCLTGRRNRARLGRDKKISMTNAEFCRVMDHLLGSRIVSEEAWVGLYSWHEPLLNPELAHIINSASERGFLIGISTNGAIRPDLEMLHSAERIDEIIFSMPGFSQESYDRIHGLQIEEVKRNVLQIMEVLRDRGFGGKAYIHFHVYQWNIGEVHEAKQFADLAGIEIEYTYAHFNSDELREYLAGTMTPERLKEVSKDLFFCYLDELFENMDLFKARFDEPEWITIDTHSNLLLSGDYDSGEPLRSIFDFQSYDDVKVFLDNAKTRDEIDEKIAVWGRIFNSPINHLFGY